MYDEQQVIVQAADDDTEPVKQRIDSPEGVEGEEPVVKKDVAVNDASPSRSAVAPSAVRGTVCIAARVKRPRRMPASRRHQSVFWS
jgi:hypothetical protein